MRLPPKIEKEIQKIEGHLNGLSGQHAGPARLRGLRFAIEEFMKQNGLHWDSSKIGIEADNNVDPKGIEE